MDSILTSVKKAIGIEEEYEHFDDALIMHINSVLFALFQIGVGDKPFVITGDDETWEDLLEDINDVSAIKDYVFLKVKLTFDPPVSTNAMTAANNLIDEYTYRINAALDTL